MDFRRAVSRIALALGPLILAACAGTPQQGRQITAEDVRADAVATVIAPEEVLQSAVANVDVSGKVAPDLWQRLRNGFAIPDLPADAAHGTYYPYNGRIQKVKSAACGFRNRERFRNAIYFHLGGLDLYPRPSGAHTIS